jgi:hypothetical protein
VLHPRPSHPPSLDHSVPPVFCSHRSPSFVCVPGRAPSAQVSFPPLPLFPLHQCPFSFQPGRPSARTHFCFGSHPGRLLNLVSVSPFLKLSGPCSPSWVRSR